MPQSRRGGRNPKGPENAPGDEAPALKPEAVKEAAEKAVREAAEKAAREAAEKADREAAEKADKVAATKAEFEAELRATLAVNPVVGTLARGLAVTSSGSYLNAIIAGGEGAEPKVYAESSDVGEVVSFEGYLGATVAHPPGASVDDVTNLWCVFYLDWDLRSWLIVERAGIVRHKQIKHPDSEEDPHDVIWVRADARVGSGRGSASVESLFLQGQFTSAGDFEAEAARGGLSPATGKFCGRSPWCCGGKTINRP